ncbi:hypothetical protein NE865_05530 [Phthorimaea operculella]|nr:hypothetical protein NE865_05530 [Phthorimaea operculella]
MSKKRSSEDEREHLLRKIKKLEKRIYDLPDSDMEEEGSKENQEEMQETPNPKPKKPILRTEIAERWQEILEKGLKKEEKEELTKLNPPFENCPKMVAPKLNKEVGAALNDNGKKRDALIELRQKQMSTSLSCLGKALQLCIKSTMDNKLDIIKKLNDSSRLLCDAMYLDTRGRRTLVLSSINKNLKDSLLETEPNEFLFGDNLTDKIKTAKAVQKSGKELKTFSDEKKQKKKPEPEKKKSLNWRGPPQTTQIRKGGGGAAYQLQQKKKYEKKPPQKH